MIWRMLLSWWLCVEKTAPGQNCHDTFVNKICALVCVSIFVCMWEALEGHSVFIMIQSLLQVIPIFMRSRGWRLGGLDTELIILIALLMLDNKQSCCSYPQNTDVCSLVLHFFTSSSRMVTCNKCDSLLCWIIMFQTCFKGNGSNK